jgi:hypothetical protein
MECLRSSERLEEMCGHFVLDGGRGSDRIGSEIVYSPGISRSARHEIGARRGRGIEMVERVNLAMKW